MKELFEFIDWLAPVIGLEGTLTLKVVVVFMTTYYMFSIPGAIATWIAYKLTWH